jgi:uncharacterized membrane protein
VRLAAPLPWWGLLATLALVSWIGARIWAEARLLPRARRAALAGLRLLLLILIVVVWMRPVSVRPTAPGRDSIVAVLIDTSRSMSIRDAGGWSRLEEAIDLVRADVLPALAGHAVAEPFYFGHRVVAADLSAAPPHASRSDLAGALREVGERYRGRALAAVVVVSDGAVTVPGAAAQAGAPVFAVGVGDPSMTRDREVLGLTLGDPSVTDSIVDLTAHVVSHGYGTDAFDVRLLEDGRPADVRRVRPATDGSPVRAAFRVSPRRGRPTVYTVEITPEPGEVTDGNNRASIVAPPPARPRRLLMLEGAPGFEHSFLKRALAGDAGLQVDAVVRKGSNEQGDETYYLQAPAERAAALTSGFPAGRPALFTYDAVVLANLPADALARTHLEVLRDFVAERGGGLVVLGSRSFDVRAVGGTPLEEMVPLRLFGEVGDVAAAAAGEGPVRLTPDGEGHPIMRLGGAAPVRDAWAGLPALVSAPRLGGPRPGASVLAVGATPGGGLRPLVAVQRYGRGRVLAFAGDGAWRWKMQVPSTDRRYETFWRQAMRWAAAPATDPVFTEATWTSSDAAEVLVTVRDRSFVPVRDATVTVRVSDPGGDATERVAPLREARTGLYAVPIAMGRTGVHRIDAVARQGGREIGRGDTWALAGGTDPELVDPRRNDDVLRRVAVASGGDLLERQELASLPGRLHASRAVRPGLEERDLWHAWWIFALLGGLACTEWTLRRRWGLR